MKRKMASAFLGVNFTCGSVRCFSTSPSCFGVKNFRKIQLYNFRGSRLFKERMKENPHPLIPVYTYGVREPGFKIKGKFHEVPEMIPELIVPDLTDFNLKPYVSYNVNSVVQEEFTARDLFDAIYSAKIVNDFKENALDENGNPKNPNEYESFTAEEARIKARQTGSDIFSMKNHKVDEYNWPT